MRTASLTVEHWLSNTDESLKDVGSSQWYTGGRRQEGLIKSMMM